MVPPNPSRLSKPSKKVIQVVYRSLLKACENGYKPEVFGEIGSKAIFNYWKIMNISIDGDGADSRIFPSKPEQVRKLLRYEFDVSAKSNEKQVDPITFLRKVNETSHILFPPESELARAGIPIFDFSSSAALKGETLSFNFFEPRYLKLAQEAITGNEWFILRGRPILDRESSLASKSILMKITDHATLEGNAFVQCTAGPRIRVLEQEEVPVEENSPPLIRATDIAFYRDEKDCDNYSLNELQRIRSKCLDLILDKHPPKLLSYHGPPPVDMENFSFWILRFTLDDIESIHYWLSCKSTGQRLRYAFAALTANVGGGTKVQTE